MVSKRRNVFRWRLYAWCILVLLLLYSHDYRPDDIERAIAPYQFSVISWELANLPDKWVRRAVAVRGAFYDDTARQHLTGDLYFAAGRRLAETERRLVWLAAQGTTSPETARELAELRQIRASLMHSQGELRGDVEETLESVVADTLQDQGFGGWAGVFPPVDTVLTGSPTVLILSPRDRIERLDRAVLATGLTGDEREQIESAVEESTDWVALVANTGGIAFYPSIARSDAGPEFAMEIISHEWVHHWLWFRPLGRRYFESGELATLNETVATIAGMEIGQLARHRMEGTEPRPLVNAYRRPTPQEHTAPNEPARFDFQAEMRVTRVHVDALLAEGDVDGAEEYMEKRRLVFVSEGYPIRKLNQAYFAFHGTYATTGAAGVNVIGEQMTELRRRSSSLGEFLRTAAEITSAKELAALLESAER